MHLDVSGPFIAIKLAQFIHGSILVLYAHWAHGVSRRGNFRNGEVFCVSCKPINVLQDVSETKNREELRELITQVEAWLRRHSPAGRTVPAVDSISLAVNNDK